MGLVSKLRSLFLRKGGAPADDAPPAQDGASSSDARAQRAASTGGGTRSTGGRGDARARSARASTSEGDRSPSGRGDARAQCARASTSERKGRGAGAPPPTLWSPSSFQVPPEEGKKRFHDFSLPDEIMHAIADLGFRYCTPIQAASLAQTMAGANVAGRAQTGTGKTAAYLVAILTRYLRSPDRRHEKPATPRALVIAPTRELCVQICADALALGKYCGLRSLAVFGGMDYAKQQHALQDGVVDLLAATPGRLIDFMRQHVVDISQVDTLVIDEADRMLDMGFIPDVRKIISRLPKDRQTLLYSATLDDDVMRLAAQWMPNPVKVEIEPEQTANANIEQKVLIVTSEQKFAVLCNLLKIHEGERVLVFGNRRSSTDALAGRLRRHGFECELLSGDVSQATRMGVLDRFKKGETKIVVATDVAGRGLHIADIGLVVNFELPYEAEDYVHRIGRTGRAGKVGTAVSFADEDESFVIPEIEEYLKEPLKTTLLDEDDPLLAPPPRAAGRDSEKTGDGSRPPRRSGGRPGGRSGGFRPRRR